MVFASLYLNLAFFRERVKNRGFLGVKMGFYGVRGIIFGWCGDDVNICIYEYMNV